ncbi:heterokaryon incompatibility protein-domain-containing protein [Apiospora arundinis]|uniref:Heterokaryon incompatibility protein-domain-containing protein n=1 Tax=Apiospora arundinis TaxID=335852 RepID=A0ABR2IH54_9PEZI
MICSYCANIFQKPDYSRSGNPCITDLRSLRSLIHDRLDCELYLVFRRDLESKGQKHEWYDSPDEFAVTFRRGVDCNMGGFTTGSYYSVTVKRREGGGLPAVGLAYRIFLDDEEQPPAAYLNLLSREEGRILHRDGASDAALRRTARMVAAHIPADLPAVPLPCRLLDLGETEQTGCVRVCETGGQYGHYITLSHCWGESQSFVTVASNLRERLAGFSVSEMPQSYQDAVRVTRLLGRRYLWIDSLCIIQKDIDDWVIESKKMGDYYNQSVLTIAAARSDADVKGFLLPRGYQGEGKGKPYHDTTIYADRCDRIYFEAQADRGSFYLANLAPLQPYSAQVTTDGNPVASAPLHGRAWTLQERLMSRFVLHFDREQNYLEDNIKRHIYYEDGRHAPLNLYGVSSGARGYSPESQLFDPDKALPYQNWLRMVDQYLTRGISDRSDTLPSLSGLAQSVARRSDDCYCAGLWDNCLATGLLWQKAHGHLQNKQRGKWQSTEYLAPSWSWTSAGGPVNFLVDDLSNPMDPDSWISGYDDDPDDIAAPLLRSARSAPVLATSDTYGRLSPGTSLSLEAPVYQATSAVWKRDIRIQTPTANVDVRAFLDDDRFILAELERGKFEAKEMNSSLVVNDIQIVFTVQVYSYGYRSHRSYDGDPKPPHVDKAHGVIIRQVPEQEPPVFQRIGVFTASEAPGCSESNICFVTLV